MNIGIENALLNLNAMQPRFDRGYTGHEHMCGFGLINMNGRLYDPYLQRFLSPDPYIISPGNAQDYNRYSYVLNNPLMFTDPSGYSRGGASFGYSIGTGREARVRFLYNDPLPFPVGGAVWNTMNWGAMFLQHSAAGGARHFTPFGNPHLLPFETRLIYPTWLTPAEFRLIEQVASLVSQILIFQKGCVELGVNGGDPVPATDQFLSDAQKAWYKDAPMDRVKLFTVEKVPTSIQEGMDAIGAAGATTPLSGAKSGKLTGMSNVYFNKNLAFRSAKQLFFTMGHELVHVSQFAALAGQSRLILTEDFRAMLDFHAYSYQNSLGGLQFSSFTRDDIIRWSVTYTQFHSMNYINLLWTFNHSFIYPF